MMLQALFNLEAAIGVEPMNCGFADQSLVAVNSR